MANKSIYDGPDKPAAHPRDEREKVVNKSRISIAEMIERLNSLPAPPDIEQRDNDESDN